MELELENPIFTVYVNVEGMSRQTAQETLQHFSGIYGSYTNATFWIFPSNITRVETVWNGKYQQNPINDERIQNMINHINRVLTLLSDGTSDEAIKAQLRELQLSKILDN
jgi:hypothetical protein